MKKFKVLEEGRFTKGELDKVKGGVVGPSCPCLNGNASCDSQKYSICEPSNLFTITTCSTDLAICGPSAHYEACGPNKFVVTCGIGKIFTTPCQPGFF